MFLCWGDVFCLDCLGSKGCVMLEDVMEGIWLIGFCLNWDNSLMNFVFMFEGGGV